SALVLEGKKSIRCRSGDIQASQVVGTLLLALNASTSQTELLSAHCAILDELRKRDIIRSKNNPTGAYTEWLVSVWRGLRLENKSAKGWDAVGKLASYRNHVNGHVMHLRPSVFSHPSVEDVTALLL